MSSQHHSLINKLLCVCVVCACVCVCVCVLAGVPMFRDYTMLFWAAIQGLPSLDGLYCTHMDSSLRYCGTHTHTHTHFRQCRSLLSPYLYSVQPYTCT